MALSGEAESASLLLTCILCGACEKTCPNKVPLLETFARAKLKHPISTKYALELYDLLRPFASKIRSAKKDLAHLSQGKVALFLGCGGEFLYPNAIKHFIKIFPEKELIFVPQDQTCCGLPFLAAGDEKAFLKSARQNLKALSLAEKVTTLCASCFFVLNELYPRLLGDEYKVLAAKTCEGHSYLFSHRAFKFSVSQEEIFFQVPCHLKNTEVYPFWRELGLSYYEGCCGQAGAFGYLFPGYAREINRKLFKEAFLTGPRFLAAACTSCLLALKKTFPEYPVKMLVEFC